ncbi:MAG: hypothetical protein LUH58_03215 [Lachnospiraceae bacterium]|nr:hypothetical protein [Lachnospiraceae bacterium]
MILKLIQYLWEKIKRPGAMWVIFSGVITAISIMYARSGLLAWISLIPYFITLYRNTDPESGKRHLFRTGFLFGCSLYLPLLSFFYALYPIESAGLTPSEAIMVILLAQLGLSAVYSLPHGVLPCVLRLLRKKRARRTEALIIPLSIPALWVLVEWAGSQTWLGMPWGRLAVS